MPVAQGAAVSRIRLYEVLDEAKYAQPIHLPPASLPHRHVFFREEMADRVIDNADRPTSARSRRRRLVRVQDAAYALSRYPYLHEGSARVRQQPGLRCCGLRRVPWWMEPLLQGPVAAGHREDEILRFEAMPYFEYAGSTGPHSAWAHCGAPNHSTRGTEQFPDYTNIGWSENFNVDLTDPETLTDLLHTLEATVVDFADEVHLPVSGSGSASATSLFRLPTPHGSATAPTAARPRHPGSTPEQCSTPRRLLRMVVRPQGGVLRGRPIVARRPGRVRHCPPLHTGVRRARPSSPRQQPPGQ